MKGLFSRRARRGEQGLMWDAGGMQEEKLFLPTEFSPGELRYAKGSS